MRVQRVTESNKSRDPDYKNRLKMKHRSNKRTGMCTEPRERSARSRRKKGVHEEGKRTRTLCGKEHALPALLCASFGSQHHRTA